MSWRLRSGWIDVLRQPRFRYRLQGIDITEQFFPWQVGDRSFARRRFSLSGKPNSGKLYFLMGRGDTIEKSDDGFWHIDDRYQVALGADTKLQPKIRTSENVRELLVPLHLPDGQQAFEVRLKW